MGPELADHGLKPHHGLYGPWNSPGQNTGADNLFFLQGNLPNPGIKTRSSTLQADSLPVEPQAKPNNTGVGSLSLLQGSFPTQELNWGLLHCRRIFLPTELSGNWRITAYNVALISVTHHESVIYIYILYIYIIYIYISPPF